MKMMKVRKGSIAWYVQKTWKPVVVLASVGLIVGGMSAAQLAFAADEPAEPVFILKAEKSLSETVSEPYDGTECEELNTELVSIGEYTITHYCPCEICCGVWAENRPDGIVYTASGAVAEAGVTVAVDPEIIPYGTKLVINGHEYIAQDCGGAIYGNKIDIYCNSHEEALQLGKYTAEVFRMEGGACDVSY